MGYLYFRKHSTEIFWLVYWLTFCDRFRIHSFLADKVPWRPCLERMTWCTSSTRAVQNNPRTGILCLNSSGRNSPVYFCVGLFGVWINNVQSKHRCDYCLEWRRKQKGRVETSLFIRPNSFLGLSARLLFMGTNNPKGRLRHQWKVNVGPLSSTVASIPVSFFFPPCSGRKRRESLGSRLHVS